MSRMSVGNVGQQSVLFQLLGKFPPLTPAFKPLKERDPGAYPGGGRVGLRPSPKFHKYEIWLFQKCLFCLCKQPKSNFWSAKPSPTLFSGYASETWGVRSEGDWSIVSTTFLACEQFKSPPYTMSGQYNLSFSWKKSPSCCWMSRYLENFLLGQTVLPSISSFFLPIQAGDVKRQQFS